MLYIHSCGSWGRKKKQYESLRKKHTPKQVILDDVGGDIISKIPTSPSFLILLKISNMIGTRLLAYTHSKQTTWDNYSLIIIQLSMNYMFFALAHDPGCAGTKHTLLTVPNLVPIKKLCQAPSCATHGGESYSVFLMGIGGKKMGGSLCGWTAVSIITPFPGTSTLGVGAARAIWVRLEIVSWRIMVKIENLGNQHHRKSFCRCSFWRIFTGHVLFCSWTFFRTALDFGPQKKHVGNSTNISCQLKKPAFPPRQVRGSSLIQWLES